MYRVALVILAVDDLRAAATFYQRAFRWRPTVETTTYVELETPGGLRLGIYHRDGYTKNFGEATLAAHPGAGVTRTEIYVYVEDLATSLECVIDAGARLLSGCHALVGRHLCIRRGSGWECGRARGRACLNRLKAIAFAADLRRPRV